MDWPIGEVARAAGTTSRTLRHYDAIGLLPPSRTGPGGRRHYDEAALVRLQRILLLRGLGLGLTAVAEALDGERDTRAALRRHLRRLEAEDRRLARQIASVRTTLTRMERGEPLMPDEVLDGFDHTRHEEEVTERWGADAYRHGDRWWRALPPEERRAFRREQAAVAAAYAEAHAAGLAADGARVREIVRRHYAWVVRGWQGRRPDAEQFAGLGRLYAEDPRYRRAAGEEPGGSADTAAFVHEAVRAYAERVL
ncbi:TipAS antibiotic-recognition domain-containing protein [Streptomyces chumphonensis]|uniref:TipAS antibiotic-recognition domain-containing protein n=1 Tax=Streptomyces chumphonensis TaxID=1214925 RepID=A0A927ICT8_9ACTN|nr:TipAS antibiotic-recognition domain-containing protein [Streptomyces chumphonensis]MBD3931606.1 TipAS antibiotic-recognition domain-containing protein [Streptomyces chumphonensis]